jgi:GTP-binding protein YchF
MALQIGIIGLPNVGKSTLFNVLTQAQNAEVANYPFCTIEPNQAIVAVPDPRIDTLGKLVKVDQVIKTTIEFVDIAGLVKGASQGEGLGNQFLGQIRNTDALLHVVRFFEDPNVIHVSSEPDPEDDIRTIQVELIIADHEQITRKIEKLSRQIKGDHSLAGLLSMAEKIFAYLNSGKMLSSFPEQYHPDFQTLNRELRFLTVKPVIYAANIGEEFITKDHGSLKKLTKISAETSSPVVQISAQLEADLIELDSEEKKEYMELSGIQKNGLDLVIHTSYQVLDLISFFTYNKQEARAWTVEEGTKAPQAAGTIHTDFERGFIKGEVVPFAIFEELGSMSAVRDAGKLRIEGKDYVVQDGDVIYFKFNV